MDFYSSAKPFIILLRAFGLFPLRFNDKRKCLFSFIDIVAPIVVFVSITFFAISNFTYRSLDLNSVILNNIWSIAVIIGCFSLDVMLIHQWIKSRSIVKFVGKINEIDQKVISSVFVHECSLFVCLKLIELFQIKRTISSINYRQHRTFLISLSLSFVGLCISISFVSAVLSALLDDFASEYLTVSYSLVQLNMTLFALQFTFVTLSVRERFKILNRHLRFIYFLGSTQTF